VFTDSIARSAKRRFLNYSEADFEIFARSKDTLHASVGITPIGATIRVYNPQN